MEQDLPFVLLGAPTSGAPGERILIKAQNAVVFGVENGFDLTPSKWEGFVSELLRHATDASYLFTAYEVGPSPAFDPTGFYVAVRCFSTRFGAELLYSWLRSHLPLYPMYRAGVWYAETISNPPAPVRLEKHSWFDSVPPARSHFMSNMNFELCGTRGLRWEILPSVPFGQIFFCPFGPVAKAPAVETGLRPDLSVLWG